MSSWKCTHCGLVNFATVEVCRRCQTSATGGYAGNQYVQPNVQQPAPQNNWHANPPAPPVNYQTGNLSQPQMNYQTGNLTKPLPQSPTNDYTQPQNFAPNDNYQQGNSFPQQNNYQPQQQQDYTQPPSYQSPQNNYWQNDGQQQSGGYAYNQGDSFNANYPPQSHSNYQQSNYAQTDYSQAPSYGAPSVGAYQPLYSTGYGAQGAGIWREGNKLVMHKQALLPDRCVKCNAPTNGEYQHRKLSWLHPAWALLILASWIIYLIVYLAIRKKAEVDLGLCEEHKAKRRTGIGIGWITALLGFASIFLAIGTEKPGFVFLGILLFLFGVIYGSIAASVVGVAKMDDNYIWMKRVNENFLANFPPTGR
jgi:hypothetical protein